MTQEFLLPLDICNRALQHLGSRRITAADFASPTTKQASAVAFCYDKLRQAELRRNTWVFSIKRASLRPIDDTTLQLAPPLVSATKYYMPGDVVADTNGKLWTTSVPFTYAQTPGDPNTNWVPYFGPLTAALYDSTDTYLAGEAVYIRGAVAGLISGFFARRDTTSAAADVPDTVETWDSTAVYKRGDIVSYSSADWVSCIDNNLNFTPVNTRALWSATTTYASGNIVIGPDDGRLYTSVGNGNLNHRPYAEDTTYWTAASSPPYVQAWVQQSIAASNAWRYYGNGATDEFKAIYLQYPLSAAVSPSLGNRNIFRLPSGFLRTAPQQPRAGSVSYLGSPSGLGYTDWEYNGNFLISQEAQPISFRFAADITDVSQMDPMFCEGLACRIAIELCEDLTQSSNKLAGLASMYKSFMGEARTVNAIEVGAVEPPVDDYIQCRA